MLSVFAGPRPPMHNEILPALAPLSVSDWFPITVIVPQYAEHRTSSLAEGVNLLAKRVKSPNQKRI
jgi:hypothetical protein